MNELITNITVRINLDEVTITIDTKDESETITAKLRAGNSFRFSYLHPVGIRENYTGFLDGRKVFFYPQYGKTFLTKNSITPMIINDIHS